MLAKDLASEARNASVVCGVWGDRARELEVAARSAELHEVELGEAQARLVLELAGALFDDCGLPKPDLLLRERMQRWPAPPDAATVEAAAIELRRVIRGELEAELEVELARKRFVASPDAEVPVVMDEPLVEVEAGVDGGDELPSWESLPAEWKRNINRDLARHEYAQALRREANDRARYSVGSPMPSRNVIPRIAGA
jgi:hypothetical protein